MKKVFILAALAMGLCLSSCTEKIEELNPAPEYEDTQIVNADLRVFLSAEGYNFTENGNLIIDEKVEQTVALDLSETNITDFAALTVFPNLNYLDLSGRGFGPVFDFSVLPEQITGVNLTGNEIYDFEGLVKVEIPEDGGDPVITNLRDIKKLYIPETMKDNYDDMVYFYFQNKKAIEDKTMDVLMADKEGKLNVYNTLRAIPDANLVKYLEHDFPSVVKDGKIDMAAGLPVEQATKAISVMNVGNNQPFEVDVENFEGIQYLINNPTWKGAMISFYGVNGKSVMPTIPVKECVTKVDIYSVDGDIDFSKASGLTQIMMGYNNTIKELDLTGATLWGTRDAAIEVKQAGSGLMINDLPALEKIVFPKGKNLNCFMICAEILPSLKELDLSSIGSVGAYFSLAEFADGCKITYPNLTTIVKDEDGYVTTAFACSTNVWDLQSTKDFLDKYYTKTKVEDRIGYGMLMNSFDEFYWQDELDK